MLYKPTDNIKDKEVKDSLEHILQEGIGKTIILSTSPTTAGGELKEDERGFDGTSLYINIGGTIYSITLTPT